MKKRPVFLYRQLGRVSIVLVVEKRETFFLLFKKFESLDFKEALKILADKAGIKLENSEQKIRQKRTKKTE